MKISTSFRKLIALAVFFAIAISSYAELLDYEKDFTTLAKRNFCTGRSQNADINVYNECILVIEKKSHKCDKITKPEFEKIMQKYSDYNKGVSEFMGDYEPVVKNTFLVWIRFIRF